MYERYFHLSGPPFQLSPDPTFIYGSRGHKRASAYLQYGLYQGEGFIVLTGDVGAGKTTLIQNLLQQLDARKIVAAQLVSTQLDAESLLRAVATAFGLRVKEHDKARLLAEVEAFLVSLVPKGLRALLIVDEAQNLSPQAVEELRMLSNFQLRNRPLMQSFLVGQPELRDLMSSQTMKQLRQRVIAAYHLGPLDADETRAYIESRLKQVGWKGDPEFTLDVFPLLHAFTGGIPRSVNTVCTRVMLSAYLSEKHVIDAADVEQVIADFSDEFGEDIAGLKVPLSQPIAGTNGSPLGRLESRVVNVEQAMQKTVNLLRQLIRVRVRSESTLTKKPR